MEAQWSMRTRRRTAPGAGGCTTRWGPRSATAGSSPPPAPALSSPKPPWPPVPTGYYPVLTRLYSHRSSASSNSRTHRSTPTPVLPNMKIGGTKWSFSGSASSAGVTNTPANRTCTHAPNSRTSRWCRDRRASTNGSTHLSPTTTRAWLWRDLLGSSRNLSTLRQDVRNHQDTRYNSPSTIPRRVRATKSSTKFTSSPPFHSSWYLWNQGSTLTGRRRRLCMNDPTPVRSKIATGGFPDPTSWRGTSGYTRARSPSNAGYVWDPSLGQTIWRPISGRTQERSHSLATFAEGSSRGRTRRKGTPRCTSSRGERRSRRWVCSKCRPPLFRDCDQRLHSCLTARPNVQYWPRVSLWCSLDLVPELRDSWAFPRTPLEARKRQEIIIFLLIY